MRYLIFLALSYTILTTYAFSNPVSEYISNLIPGEGDTEVQITAGRKYHPEFSIVTVRPLAAHPGVDAWFVQLQLNECHKNIEKAIKRGISRIEIVHGIGEGVLKNEVHKILRHYNLRFYLNKDGGSTEVFL